MFIVLANTDNQITGGLVSNDNTFPAVGSGDIQRFCQLGPLCRRSEDLWPLLVAMKTPPTTSTAAAATPTADHGIDVHACSIGGGGYVSEEEENEEGAGVTKQVITSDTPVTSATTNATANLYSPDIQPQLQVAGPEAGRDSLDESSDCSTCSEEGGSGMVLFTEGQLLRESSAKLLQVILIFYSINTINCGVIEMRCYFINAM